MTLEACEAMIQRLGESGYIDIDPDPHALVRMVHRPADPKAGGFFKKAPMHSVALTDSYTDSPSRFLEIALATGRAVQAAVRGEQSIDRTEHPTIEALAGMISMGLPGSKRKKLAKFGPHWLAIIVDFDPAPSWIASVLDGCVHDNNHGDLVCTIVRNHSAAQIIRPNFTSKRAAEVNAWLDAILSP